MTRSLSFGALGAGAWCATRGFIGLVWGIDVLTGQSDEPWSVFLSYFGAGLGLLVGGACGLAHSRRRRPSMQAFAASRESFADRVAQEPERTGAVMREAFLYQPGDEIEVLGLVAPFAFKSPGSISFNLGQREEGLLTLRGWLDVHYPCEDHIKVQLRVVLPAAAYTWEQLRDSVRQVFSALGIPADETYEATFVIGEEQVRIEQATDRNGGTDRLY